jgi:hypothetical protein
VPPKDKPTSPDGPRGYFDQSRDLMNSLVLVLPLLLIYQAGLFTTQGQTLNGADFVTVFILRRWDFKGLLIFNFIIIIAGAIAAGVMHRKRRFEPSIAVPIAIESTVYAVLLGVVISQTLAQLGVHPPRAQCIAPWLATGQAGALPSVCMALGAGVNEELVFRLGMVPLFAAIAGKGMPRAQALLVAVIASSAIFSAAHYLGPEDFLVYTFLYRFLAGVIFCVIFAARGFAVAVYTHAIYDVLVMVVLR